MKEKLLTLLACPSCAGDVRVSSVSQGDDARGWAEIVEGELSCRACARAFPVRRGVPRFADAREIGADKASTAENFGWQWQHFTQGDEHYGEQFLGWIAPVRPEFFTGKPELLAPKSTGRPATSWR